MIKCYCGHEAKIQLEQVRDGEGLLWMRCDNPDCRASLGFEKDEKELIKKWNEWIRPFKKKT